MRRSVRDNVNTGILRKARSSPRCTLCFAPTDSLTRRGDQIESRRPPSAGRCKCFSQDSAKFCSPGTSSSRRSSVALWRPGQRGPASSLNLLLGQLLYPRMPHRIERGAIRGVFQRSGLQKTLAAQPRVALWMQRKRTVFLDSGMRLVGRAGCTLDVWNHSAFDLVSHCIRLTGPAPIQVENLSLPSPRRMFTLRLQSARNAERPLPRMRHACFSAPPHFSIPKIVRTSTPASSLTAGTWEWRAVVAGPTGRIRIGVHRHT